MCDVGMWGRVALALGESGVLQGGAAKWGQLVLPQGRCVGQSWLPPISVVTPHLFELWVICTAPTFLLVVLTPTPTTRGP